MQRTSFVQRHAEPPKSLNGPRILPILKCGKVEGCNPGEVQKVVEIVLPFDDLTDRDPKSHETAETDGVVLLSPLEVLFNLT